MKYKFFLILIAYVFSVDAFSGVSECSTPPQSPIRPTVYSNCITPAKRSGNLDITSNGVDFFYDYQGILHFNKGDLIYGLSKARLRSVNEIKNSNEYFKNSLLTIDEYNKIINNLMRGKDLNNLDFISNDDEFNKELNIVNQELIAEYNWESNKEDKENLKSYIMFLKEKKLLEKINFEFDEDKNGFTRDACISGIDFNCKNERKIHFILDGLNLDDVLDIQSPSYYSFTSLELKHIFKISHSNPNLLNCIKFYSQNKIVSPPWSQNELEWKKVPNESSDSVGSSSLPSSERGTQKKRKTI